jgi:hypothetical protein
LLPTGDFAHKTRHHNKEVRIQREHTVLPKPGAQLD